MGLLGSTAGIEGAAVGAVVLPPNVKGVLVTVAAFLSFSPVRVPNEKREDVGAAAEVVATVVVVVVVVVVVETMGVDVAAADDPKLNALVLAVVVAGVLTAVLGAPNEKPVVLGALAALVAGVSLDGLLVATELNKDGVVVFGASVGVPNENPVVVIFGASAGAPNENPVDGTDAVGTADEVVNGVATAGVVDLSAMDGAGEPNKGAEVVVETAAAGAGEPKKKGFEVVDSAEVLAGEAKAIPGSATVCVVGAKAAMEKAFAFVVDELATLNSPEPKETWLDKLLFTGLAPKLKEPFLMGVEVGILKFESEAARRRTSRSGTLGSTSDWNLLVLNDEPP